MHPSSAQAVRLLAAWQLRRRELDDRLEGLLLHGPTAVERVADRADELRDALERERSAFEAFVLGVREPHRSLPVPVDRTPPGPRGQQVERAYPPLRAVRSDA